MKHAAISMILLTSLSAIAIDTDVETFFKTVPDPGKKLPSDQIYPNGQLFPFTFYSTGGGTEEKRGDLLPVEQKEADMKKIIDAGVTMIGPQYELNDSIVVDARKYKVKAVYTITPEIDGEKVDRAYLKKLEKEKKPLDAQKLRAAVIEIVKREAVNPEIAWWDITPEELRWWMKNDMLCLKTVSDAVREADPLKRPVYMYEPGHRDVKALSKTVVFQNICGKGMYANYSSCKNARAYCPWSINAEIEAIKASGKKDVIPIALPEMFQDPAEKELSLIDSWVRHDVYSALIAGAKGVAVFSASKRPNFKAREQYLDAYLKICKELNGPMQLGHIFLFGERKDDLTLSILEGPEKVELNIGKDNELKLDNKKREFPSTCFANIAFDNCRYVFIANSSEEPISAIVNGLVYGSGITVEDIFNPANKFTAPEGDFSVNIAPLGIRGFKIYNSK